MNAGASELTLGGEGLTIEDLVRVARDPGIVILLSPAAMEHVNEVAVLVEGVVNRYKLRIGSQDPNPTLDYGITTGFGEFKRIPIDPERLGELQTNILLSHAAGVGETLDEADLANYYPPEVIRAVLVLRINAFLQGHSGIRLNIIRALAEMVNQRVIPLVPIRGSVGSSGDLAPLAHLFLWLCDEGRAASKFYQINHDGSNWKAGPLRPSIDLPQMLGVATEEIKPTAKEGLALTNGATFSAAMLALAVHDAESLTLAADLAVAMSMESLLGCARAFDEKVHKARHQTGQIESARWIRGFLNGSSLVERFAEVQDPYSIRCAPAVHGASRDTLEFVRKIVSREINAATDNPLFFGEEPSWDWDFQDNWATRRDKRLGGSAGSPQLKYDGKERRSYSACNFHGQPVALAADFLAIALAELANISERRTQLLMDRDHNRGLPANLMPDAGLNSGFMIAQYCAAGLVSENKVLAHPASVDSIPTSSNSEDHNSMATIAARKLRTVLANARHTLAIEFLVAAQALEWATMFESMEENALGEEYQVLSEKYLKLYLNDNKTRAELWEFGGVERELFTLWTGLENRGRISQQLGLGTREAYLVIRNAVEPMLKDRVLAGDIRLVAVLLAPKDEALADLIRKVSELVPKTTQDSGKWS